MSDDLTKQLLQPAPASAPKRRIKPFNDIARGFDPMMPKEDYDKQREHYFNSYVAPHYKNATDRSAGWTKFQSLTERKPLLTSGEKLTLPASIAAHQFFASAEKSVASTDEFLNEHINKHLWGYDAGKREIDSLRSAQKGDEKASDRLEQLGAREGATTRTAVGKATGQFAEAGVELYGLGEIGKLVGAAAEGIGLIKAGTTTAKNLQIANRIVKGGPTFGIYEALHDEKGFGHAFLDGSFIRGMAEGRIWSFAGSGKAVARVLKSGVTGAGLGAIHAPGKGQSEAAVVGGAMGAVFGLLPGEETETKVSAKETATQRALTPEVSKHLEPQVDASLAQEAVKGVVKAQREMKVPEINIDEKLHGVRIRVTDAQGQPGELKLSPYAEGKTLGEIQKLVMAGGKVEGIDYSTTHGDTLNRFLKMQKAVESGDKNVEKRLVEQSKVPAPPKELTGVDKLHDTINNGDKLMKMYQRVPKNSELYKDYTNARTSVTDALVKMKENLLWTANRLGSSAEERKSIDQNLTTLINGRSMHPSEPSINQAIRALAYKPELRAMIPPQFRGLFDAANLQLAPGTKFETSVYQFKDQFKKLQAVAPRRDVDELMEMSKLLAKIEKGPPSMNLQGVEDTTPIWERTARVEAYHKAYQESLSYPEIGDALSPEKKVAWNSDRQQALEKKAKELEERRKEALTPRKVTTPDKNQLSLEKLIWDRREGNMEPYLHKPGKVDATDYVIPPLDDMSPSEIDQVMQEEIEKKSRGIQNPGVAEELLRTGQWSRDQYARKTFAEVGKIPESEDFTGELVRDKNYKFEDGVLKVYIPDWALERQGVGAFYQPTQILSTLEKMGFKDIPEEIQDHVLQGHRWIDANNNLLAGKGSGMVVLPAEVDPAAEVHELFHHAMDHVAGLDGVKPSQFVSSPKHLRIFDKVAQALDTFKVYEGSPLSMLHEEAIVHAATAVMQNDSQVLYALGMVDTSVKDVVAMVHDFSGSALDKLRERPDWVELRDVKNRFDTLQHMTSPEVSYSLVKAADRLSAGIHTDWFGRTTITLSNGTEFHFSNKNEAFKFILRTDESSHAPSVTMPLEQMGVLTSSETLSRFAPRTKVTMDPSPESRYWEGRMAISSLWRPMLPWVADVQKKLDESWQGLQTVPLLEQIKKVDQTFQDSSNWLDQQRDLFARDLKQFSSKRLYDVFKFISTEQRFWPTMEKKYEMSPEEMTHVQTLYDNLRSLDATHHLGVFNYFIRELPLLRRNGGKPDGIYPTLSDPSKASTFYRGILEGRFKPQDEHAGRFINFVLKASQDKVMEKPIAELNKTINLKDKDGGYIMGSLRAPLKRYSDYMTNHPDISQRMINAATEGLQYVMLEQFKKINKHLPQGAQLPEEFEYPGAMINKLMSLSYVSGLGLRMAVPIRDALQVVTTTLPVMGFKNFSRGITKALTGDGWREAEKAGALLHQANVGELYGDIYREIPVGGNSRLDKAVELSNKLLTPSRAGHNVGRAIGYHGSFEAATRGISDLRAGRITPEKFTNDTGLWFLGKADRSQYLTQAIDPQIERGELAKRIALELVDRTLWPYRRGTQPGMLRTGAGRIFGQYGMWPLNYIEYLRTVSSRALEGNTRAIQAGAMWLGVNLATYEILDQWGGVDAGKWLFLSPAGYAGGPQLEFVQNLMKAPEESSDGLKARKAVLEYPLNFVPAMNQMRSTLDTINDPRYWDESTNMPTEPGWLKLLGFRPVDEKERDREDQWTLEQRLRHEGGFKPGKGDIFGDPK